MSGVWYSTHMATGYQNPGDEHVTLYFYKDRTAENLHKFQDVWLTSVPTKWDIWVDDDGTYWTVRRVAFSSTGRVLTLVPA